MDILFVAETTWRWRQTSWSDPWRLQYQVISTGITRRWYRCGIQQVSIYTDIYDSYVLFSTPVIRIDRTDDNADFWK